MSLTLACALAAGAVPAGLRAQTAALELSEVLELHRRGVSARQILRSAAEYCIAFSMTDSLARELAAAGADSTLLAGLREACVVRATPPLPPGVLLDDDFKSAGRLTAVDQLCAVWMDPRGMRMENRRDGGCAIAYPWALDSGDVRVELRVAQLTGSPRASVALGFGKDSLSWDQYTVAITADGQLELGETIRGRFRRLRYQKHVTALHADTSENLIAVEFRGRSVDVYLNDAAVLTYVADRDMGPGISLGVGPRSKVLFTRLRVKKSGAVATLQ